MADHVCTRCYGDKVLPGYKHIEQGVCFECRGTGRSSRAPRRMSKPVEDRKKMPHPSAAESRRLADVALERVATLFRYFDANKPWPGKSVYDSVPDPESIGVALSGAIFDFERFQRAVRRARERLPSSGHEEFEKGLAYGVNGLAAHYEGIIFMR